MRKRAFVRWLVLFLLGCLLSNFSVACGSQQTTNSQSTPTNTPLVVGVQPWVGFQGHYIAMAKNLFSTEGVNVKQEFFQAATDTNTALAAGKVDLAWIGGPDLLTLVAQVPSLKIIMVSDYSNGADGIVGHNVSKPEDLKGKKVAREDAPYAIVFLGEYLKKGGLTEKDVQVVPLSASDAAAAVAANRVNAATTYEPWLNKAVKESKADILFTSKDTNIIPIVLATRAEVIQNRKDAVLAYLRTIDKALKFATSNQKESAEIIAKNLGVTPQEVPEQLAGIKPFDIEGNKSVPFNPSNPLYLVTSLESASKTLNELGKITKPVDAKNLVDGSLINSL